jgi:gluconate 5-dehydrogenase
MHPFSLQGQCALVTGGATGIGFGVAKSFIEAGAEVIIIGRRKSALLEAQTQLGEQCHVIEHDVLQFDQADSLMEQAAMLVKTPTILVNNAGVHLKKAAVDMEEHELQHLLNVHVVGAQALSRAFAKPLLGKTKGSIIYMASMTSFIGMPMVPAYSAAKSAQLGVVRSLSAEWAEHGVRVNAIAPGWIDTPMLHQAVDHDPVRKNKILGRTSMGKFGETSDIGNTAVFLASEASKFITSICIPVDGGALNGF